MRHQYELIELLANLNAERGVTLILSLHDLEQAAQLAHRIAVVHRGRLYDVGTPESVVRPDMMLDVFGVDSEIAQIEGRLRVRIRGPEDPVRSL